MKEFSFLEEKNKNMEFITPIKLRKFIVDKVGKCNVVFDPAVGSGQLVYNIDCNIKLGNDINERSIVYAIENGITATNEDYILYDDSNINYDTVVSNYPFSLTPTEEHKEYLEQSSFFSQFTNKQNKFSGKLDFVFILKSFMRADRGFYLCFPGIGYRSQELKYRQYLIDNGFVKEIGIITNAGFKDTSIDILYLELTKEYNEKITISKYDMDNDTNNKYIDIKAQDIIKNEYSFNISSYIQDDIVENKINIVELEEQINLNFYKLIKNELDIDLHLIECGLNNPINIIAKITSMQNLLKEYTKKINSFSKKD